MEWSDGTKATLTPTDRIGELGFGLGLRALQAERALRAAEARIRELEAELLGRASDLEGWKEVAASLRQSIKGLPLGDGLAVECAFAESAPDFLWKLAGA
jgi:hypothetical protein